MSTEPRTPEENAVIDDLMTVHGLTREAAEALLAEQGDRVELAADDLDITINDES